MGRVTDRTNDRIAFALTVTGRVQGVGYRFFAREAANGLRLAGWVQNSKDGTVAVEVAGIAADMESFVAMLRQGPPGSSVSDIRATRIDPARVAATSFEVRS
jgi:acylphosphatase